MNETIPDASSGAAGVKSGTPICFEPFAQLADQRAQTGFETLDSYGVQQLEPFF